MTLLVGPRQAGKTTLMLQLQDDLRKRQGEHMRDRTKALTETLIYGIVLPTWRVEP